MQRVGLLLICVWLLHAGRSDAAPACGKISSFAVGKSPTFEIHVSVSGSDTAGDGTASKPFASIRKAASLVRPGAAIRIHSGTYSGDNYVENIAGTHSAPVWIGGAPNEAPPVLSGGSVGLHLVKVRFLIIHDLVIQGTASHGINIDDNGEATNRNAVRSIVLRNLNIHDASGQCLKMAGVNDFRILDSRFARCAVVNIDGVGVHDGVIANSVFEPSDMAIQVKGGSSNVEIRWNRITGMKNRGVNMGGSTGETFFRPPLSATAANYEAKDIRAIANVFENCTSPAALVGCVNCVVANNTIVDPASFIIRILQETVSIGIYGFAPAGYGQIYNNIMYFNRSAINGSEFVNVGANTDPASFQFKNDLWYARDNPSQSKPPLPVPEQDGIYGLDPMFINPGGGTYQLMPTSPAAGTGFPLGIKLDRYSTGDFEFGCWSSPPSIGAYEVQAGPTPITGDSQLRRTP